MAGEETPIGKRLSDYTRNSKDGYMMKSNYLGQGERWCPLCRLVGSLQRAQIFGYASIFWALILQLIGHKLEWIVLVWQLFANFFKTLVIMHLLVHLSHMRSHILPQQG
jgi:hypothetical protein